jgi:hypothetical protein
MVLSHHRNVIIITILQASLRFMRAPTSTQMTTMTEAWITTPHLPIPLYYPHLTFLLVYFPSCYLPYATNLTPASNATDRDHDCDRDCDHDCDCLTMAPGHD